MEHLVFFLPLQPRPLLQGAGGRTRNRQRFRFQRGERTSGASVIEAAAVAVAVVLAFALVAAVAVTVTITVEFTVAIAGAHTLRRRLSIVVGGQGKELEKPVSALHTSGAPGMTVASFDGFGDKYLLWRKASGLGAKYLR